MILGAPRNRGSAEIFRSFPFLEGGKRNGGVTDRYLSAKRDRACITAAVVVVATATWSLPFGET
ncbi:MAG: hypothetical protein D6812_07430 [Deltaproteobacteria bacterium]|nr:MAG: hypothetical protein D6812_07430 [Deltaproteobacteria bacterium]